MAWVSPWAPVYGSAWVSLWESLWAPVYRSPWASHLVEALP